jgi:hypothetical protein
VFYFLFPTNINFVVKYILFLFLLSELDYYSNIVNVNMSMILSQGHVVFFTEAFSHLFVTFYESHVFSGSHQNPIEGKHHALSYSQWPGNATHHVLPVEFPRGIRSQTYAPHNGKLSEIYQETIKTQTFYNEELYLHDGTYKTVDKPGKIVILLYD